MISLQIKNKYKNLDYSNHYLLLLYIFKIVFVFISNMTQ